MPRRLLLLLALAAVTLLTAPHAPSAAEKPQRAACKAGKVLVRAGKPRKGRRLTSCVGAARSEAGLRKQLVATRDRVAPVPRKARALARRADRRIAAQASALLTFPERKAKAASRRVTARAAGVVESVRDGRVVRQETTHPDAATTVTHVQTQAADLSQKGGKGESTATIRKGSTVTTTRLAMTREVDACPTAGGGVHGVVGYSLKMTVSTVSGKVRTEETVGAEMSGTLDATVQRDSRAKTFSFAATASQTIAKRELDARTGKLRRHHPTRVWRGVLRDVAPVDGARPVQDDAVTLRSPKGDRLSGEPNELRVLSALVQVLHHGFSEAQEGIQAAQKIWATTPTCGDAVITADHSLVERGDTVTLTVRPSALRDKGVTDGTTQYANGNGAVSPDRGSGKAMTFTLHDATRAWGDGKGARFSVTYDAPGGHGYGEIYIPARKKEHRRWKVDVAGKVTLDRLDRWDGVGPTAIRGGAQAVAEWTASVPEVRREGDRWLTWTVGSARVTSAASRETFTMTGPGGSTTGECTGSEPVQPAEQIASVDEGGDELLLHAFRSISIKQTCSGALLNQTTAQIGATDEDLFEVRFPKPDPSADGPRTTQWSNTERGSHGCYRYDAQFTASCTMTWTATVTVTPLD